MRQLPNRSPIAQLMWGISFLAILAAMFANSQRSDPSAWRDSRIILGAGLALFAAYFIVGLWRRHREVRKWRDVSAS